MTKKTPGADSLSPDKLPDNLADCHNLIRELFARISALEKQLSRRNRAAFGKKSAKVNSSLLTGTGKAIHSQTEEELEDERRNLNIVETKNKGGGRSPSSSKSVEQREEKHTITDPSTLACPCCGDERTVFGFDASSQIDFVKPVFEEVKHVVYKYSCKKCGKHVLSAEKPFQPIDKAKAGPGLLAKITTDKLLLHLPLYRQEKVFKALSLPINRASMSRWLKACADFLKPIVERMKVLFLQSRVILADATTMPVIKKGLGKTHRGIIWSMLGDSSNPYTIYDFSETEHAMYPEKILKGFKGVLLSDGTNKFNRIIAAGATSANCWAHVHCRFEEAWLDDKTTVEFPMGVIKSLFDIERVAKNLTEEQRKDMRLRLAKPKLALLKTWLDENALKEPPKSKLSDAISYTLNRWDALCLYADTGYVDISNNACERSIKPIVLGRSNWLFAGSIDGGHTSAILMTLIQTCERLNINSFEYLKDVLTRFPNANMRDLDDFLPDRWLALRQTKHQ
jgi:transposase